MDFMNSAISLGATLAGLLAGSGVLVCTVIGFPLGANTLEIKMLETLDAIKNGADEIDMVINVAKAKENDYAYIEREIKAVVSAAGFGGDGSGKKQSQKEAYGRANDKRRY